MKKTKVVRRKKQQRTRRFGKRKQQLFQKKSRSKRHRGGKGNFDLASAIDWESDNRLNIMEKVQKLYLGYAMVKKKFTGININRRQVMVVIGRNKSTKKAMLVIIKCKSETNCSNKSNIKVHEILELKDNGDDSFDYKTTGLLNSYNIKLDQAPMADQESADFGLMDASRFTAQLKVMAKINDFELILTSICNVTAEQDERYKRLFKPI